jgi:hypothetical protein
MRASRSDSVRSRRFVSSRLAGFVAQAGQFLITEAFIDLEHLSRAV